MNLLTVAEAAERLSLCQKQVRRLIDSGELPHIRLGKRAIRLKPDDVTNFIEKMRRAG